jgi:large subunit ribosomal protein L3
METSRQHLWLFVRTTHPVKRGSNVTMKFILAKKLEMSQVFRPDGTVVPVTLVQAGPCVVTQVKTPETDGYTSVQLGFAPTRKLAKPQAGHLKDLPTMSALREFRLEAATDLKRGDSVEASTFTVGDTIHVTGTSKGRGFQGVVKRHGFSGGPASHGHKDQARMPGSIGPGGVQHVLKGRRMAGRMGDEQVTVQNLEVIEVRDGGILAVKGAVPGARHSLLKIVSP